MIQKIELVGIYFLIPALYHLNIFSKDERFYAFLAIFVYLLISWFINHRDSYPLNLSFHLHDFIFFILLWIIAIICIYNSDLAGDFSFNLIRFLIFYMIFSVVFQELFFRVHFFNRFKNFSPNQLLIFNVFAFAYFHIIFQNWITVVLSLIAGIIFTLYYQKNRSFLMISILHFFIGSLVFLTKYATLFTSDVYLK